MSVAAGSPRCSGARPYLPLVMGLALLAGTFGGAHGRSPAPAGPVRQAPAVSVAVPAAPAGAQAASGAAPLGTRADAQVVAAPVVAAPLVSAPQAATLVERVARASAPAARQPATGPLTAVRPAPARG